MLGFVIPPDAFTEALRVRRGSVLSCSGRTDHGAEMGTGDASRIADITEVIRLIRASLLARPSWPPRWPLAATADAQPLPRVLV